jgi:hydrogenase maturation protease
LQALGNRLIALFGARSVHPIGVRVGGFSRAPDATEVSQVLDEIHSAIPEAEALLAWVAALDLMSEAQKFTCVAMRDTSDYPMNTGRLVSNTGLDLGITDFESRFEERQVPHSTALYCTLDGQPYLVGPLARLNLNLDRLPPRIQVLVKDSGITFPSFNMFHSIAARALEILLALHEASRILSDYSPAQEPYVHVEPRAGVGFGCTEAPRGVLWHRYELNNTGHVVNARIVPPTSQNQGRIEADLRESIITFGLNRSETDIRLLGEKVIRNYDPCISCATHFLKLILRRDDKSVDKKRLDTPQSRSATDSEKKIRVIGVGSPFGSDSLGLDVVDYLSGHKMFTDAANVEITALDRPGTVLLEKFEDADCVILIDAIQLNVDGRQVVTVDGSVLAKEGHGLSSHELGVNAVMSLADALDLSTEHVLLIGLPVAANSAQSWSKDDISRVAEAVVATVARLNSTE